MNRIRNNPKLVIFVTIMLDMLGFGIIIPVLPTFSKELGATNLEVGGIAAIYSLMNFLFAPWWGMLSDKHGRRPIILISILLTGSAYLLLGFSSSLVVLILSRMFSGIGSANISVAQAYISDVTPPKERAKAMGMIGAAFGLGFIFGPLIGGVVASEFGTAALGFLAGGLSFVNFGMAWFMLPESLKELNRHHSPKLFKFAPLIAVLKRESISSLFYINFIYITAFSMMQITSVLLWKERYHLDEKHVGYLFALIGLTSAIVQGGLIGRLNKYFGEERLLILGLICVVIGLGSIPFSPINNFFYVQALSLILLAFGSGCATPSINSLLSRLAGSHEQGQILGLNMSFGSMSRVVGPILGGLFYELNYHLPFVGGAVLTMTSFILLIPLHNRLKAKILDTPVQVLSTDTN